MQRSLGRFFCSTGKRGTIISMFRRNAGASASAMDEMPRLVDCRQGEKVRGTFSDQEMQSRLDKLRGYMKDSKIEACVFTSIHNINYFSDFLYCAFGRPYALVVTMDDSTSVSASKFVNVFCLVPVKDVSITISVIFLRLDKLMTTNHDICAVII